MDEKRTIAVTHVAPIADQQVSGPSQSVPALVGALHRLGVATGILTTRPDGPYTVAQPYPVAYYERRCGFSHMPPPLDKPDLVVFHGIYRLAHGRLAAHARRMGTPYVVTPRGGMTKGAQRARPVKKWLGNLLFIKQMIRHAAAIHCLTDREAADAARWGRPVFVVNNGVDLPSPDRLALPGRGPGLRLVFLGRLDIYYKGLDLLLQACALATDDLRRAGAQVHLYGPDWRDSKRFLVKMISSRRLDGLVQMHDPVAGAAKEQVFRAADVFLCTSRSEGHPMAALEALSYGVPCLVTPGTNIAAEVVAAGAGVEVAAIPAAIAAGMRDLLARKDDLQAMGRGARAMTEREEYSWDAVARNVLGHYRRIIGA